MEQTTAEKLSYYDVRLQKKNEGASVITAHPYCVLEIVLVLTVPVWIYREAEARLRDGSRAVGEQGA